MDNEEVKVAPEGVETGETPSTPDPVREDVASSEAGDGQPIPVAQDVTTDPDFEVSESPADPQFAEEVGRQVPGTVGTDAPLGVAPKAPALLRRSASEVDAMMFAGVSLVIMLAKICHEANKAYCQMIGDFSHQPWESCGAEMQMSVIDGVRFHLQDPDREVSTSHENWLKFKAANGWTYGEVKDAAKKEHPCFVPFEQLPETDKRKSYLFKSIVDTFRP